MPSRRTASQRLADLALGEPIEVWAQRHRDDERAFPWISRKLAEVTDGVVEIDSESIRRWCAAAADGDLLASSTAAGGSR